MARSNNLAPVLFLNIDNKSADDLLGFLVSFTYKKSLKKAAETRLVFRNDNLTLIEDPRFRSNVPWSFRYGFFTDISPIITGHVRQIEPLYAEKRLVTVQLLDLSIKLKKSSSGRNWGRIKASDIAVKIAKKYGIDSDVEDSFDVPEKDFIQPAMINDLMYLRDLAADIDFEVYVDGHPPTLIFRSRGYDLPSSGKITYYGDDRTDQFVYSFKPKIKSLGEMKTATSKTNTGKGKGKKSTNTKGAETFKPDEKQQQVLDEGGIVLGGATFKGSVNPTKYKVDPNATGIADSPFKKTGGEIRVDAGTENLLPVTKPVASSGNTARLAASRRQQMLDKANEASSSHPLTASWNVGKQWEWAGLDEPLNRKWYLREFSVRVDGNGHGSSCEWTRDDPSAQKKGNKGQKKEKPPKQGGGAGADIPLGDINFDFTPKKITVLPGTQQETKKPKAVPLRSTKAFGDPQSVVWGPKF